MAAKTGARRQYGTGAVSQECTPKCPPAVEVIDEDGKKRRVRPRHNCPGRWIGTVEAGMTAKGTRRRIKVTGKTQAEAKAKLKEKQRQIMRDGLPVAGASTKTTVSMWAKTWTERRAAEVRHHSAATDVSQVRRWIIPAIGHVRLEQLTPAHVRAVSLAITGAGRSTSTALRAQVVLKKMLRDAIQDGYTVPPRVLEVPNPPKAVTDRDAIALLDAHAILKAAANLGPAGSRWIVAFLQGMRQGECLGLTWDAIDFGRKVIHIEWQLDAIPYRVAHDPTSGPRIKPGMPHRHLAGRWHLVPPKSKSGARVIPLLPVVETILTAWREVAPKSRHGLVWPDADGGPLDDKIDSATWQALQDAAQVVRIDQAPDFPGMDLDERGGPLSGRRYELHEIRHTTATLLMEEGVPDTVITAIMGHSSIVSSQAYLHASQAQATTALDGVAARLGLTAQGYATR